MLSPQDTCATCSGLEFVDVTSLEVFGAPAPNVLPAGALAASPAHVAPGGTVSFDASSFTDPDSRITGYDWDFDGNGSVDRTTDAPRVAFAYGAAGTFAPTVRVKDFRGGAGTASTTVTVATPPPPAPPVVTPPATTPRPLPVITIARSGTRGRVTIRVTCAQRCVLSGRVTLTRSLARKLHRSRLTVTTVTRRITSTERQTIRVKLSKAVLTALGRRGLKSLKVNVRAVARYSDGRAKTASRRLRVRR
jgi:hypothetical protein